MAYEQVIKNYFQTVSGFWLAAADAWQKARDKASKTPPYKADDLTTDAVTLWAKAMDAWWSLIPPVGSPVLPTVSYVDKASALPGQKPELGHVTCIYPLPDPPTLKCTDLGRVGGAGSIPAARVDVQPGGTGFDVYLDYTTGGAGPSSGLYQGLIYEASLNMPLAAVVVNLTT